MTTKFTPGPWKISTESYPSIPGRLTISSESTEDCVASIPAPWLHKQANANLIAAAPEMYEALKDAILLIESYKTARHSDILVNARIAIAKADGK